MKYMYVYKTALGYRVYIDIPGTCSREGMHYIGYSRKNAIKAFRQDFKVVGKHFTIIDV